MAHHWCLERRKGLRSPPELINKMAIDKDKEDDSLANVPNTDLSSLLDEGQEKSELDKIFEKMLDPTNIHHNTEVTQEEINGFSTLYAMSRDFKARGYQIEVLEKWLLEQMKLRVSKGRAGRKEWVKITTKMQDESNRKGGFLDMFRRD